MIVKGIPVMTRTIKELKIQRILDTYGDSLFRLACSYLHNEADAQEVVQDTIIQLLRYEPDLPDSDKEKAWLMKTAANLSRNKLRFNRRHDTEEIDERFAAVENEDLSYVWDAVKQLPVKYREVVHLYYQEGYTTAEIAGILDRRESTIRSDLSRAREKLRLILKEVYDFE